MQFSIFLFRVFRINTAKSAQNRGRGSKMASKSKSLLVSLFSLLLGLQCVSSVGPEGALPGHEGLPGHLQPLGAHMEPEPIRRFSHLPSPREFYEGYVAPKTPVIIEGALEGSPVWKHWQDDQYIRLAKG